MLTLLVALGSFALFFIAYHTYGRWLTRSIFQLDKDALVPSVALRDDLDFVPTKKEIIFGHHFTSIAGTGPIVGPAIAVFWGWLPALAWILFGAVFVGAVHDFGSLVVSMRNRGQTVGEIAGRLISPRARILFLLVLFMSLTVVLAIFGLVIAVIFANYPETVLPVWITMPIAIAIGIWVYKKGGGLVIPSLLALFIMYFSIYIGAYYLPIDFTTMFNMKLFGDFPNIVITWTFILLIYCAVASILPVWLLLQPRDYINSHQLLVAMGLLVAGVIVAGVTNQADLAGSAPMIADMEKIPADAPPIWPFLFITIACGACSGFHCLVSSGTSSKQLACETDAKYVGYGSMLTEGALAVIVILACCAGVGMGKFDRVGTGTTYDYVIHVDQATGKPLTGEAAWNTRYDPTKKWSDFKLTNKVAAFIEGGANFLSAIGIPLKMGIGIIAVLVASFAATTLDSATRLQRYVIQELGHTCHVKPLCNKYIATGVAVGLAAIVAMIPQSAVLGPGSGGLILWPLFGATNQLLAGMAFMVIAFYLWRRNKPTWFIVPPMIMMCIMPAWAMFYNLFDKQTGWAYHLESQSHLFVIGLCILALQIWMVIEALIIWPKAKGVLETTLPPLELPRKTVPAETATNA